MRWSALLVAGTIGVAWCEISLIDARGRTLFGREDAQIVLAHEGAQAAMPHVMRGWARTPPKALWWPAVP